ncbi:hydrogenase maturation nickel metallochaperone HypA [Rhodoplanes sp. TEM]|uniref:Hydrogenase maturation factor HypA n=1 Tax=Rhodoplanes tepidamans TaxID=200616 RepID=A0ABT5J842_RHOTP|nr:MULTISPECIES: hydrogenase maturation nickel metallochaperone HypA [Rhodoplanes]MDC7785210.1 hydrogenase maturation nickel metallochaperone HypA [Rhodoplanes tepidamans]MDC7986749.1 hydrogenase maturation nickel metallochaperone HypA [Rhodoplanes sp. TEM]MDQ0353468.1 hydrogenase nickel incorporation protein HypA/HybF [Rhodoplanes tepidamans]
MHEAAVVDGLIRILVDRAAGAGIARIVSVKVVIGRLRGLDPRQIRGCFEILAEGTVAEGARLDVVAVETAARCRTCGRDYAVPRFRFVCPACGGSDADVTHGRELHVESFEGIGAAADIGTHDDARGHAAP